MKGWKSLERLKKLRIAERIANQRDRTQGWSTSKG